MAARVYVYALSFPRGTKSFGGKRGRVEGERKLEKGKGRSVGGEGRKRERGDDALPHFLKKVRERTT